MSLMKRRLPCSGVSTPHGKQKTNRLNSQHCVDNEEQVRVFFLRVE